MKLSDLTSLPIFPFADEFPYVSDQELLELAQDIEANGLLVPVVVFEGQILDGRNRLRAISTHTNLTEVPTKQFEGDELDALDYVASLNLRRRDLDQTQRAFIGRAYKAQAAEAAKLRMLAAQNNHAGAAVELIPQQVVPARARDEAGAKAGVSGRYIDMADRVATLAPDLVGDCRAGKIAITKALDIIKQRQESSPGATAPQTVSAPADVIAERLEKRFDTAVSNLSDIISDLGVVEGRPDYGRMVLGALRSLTAQAERTFDA